MSIHHDTLAARCNRIVMARLGSLALLTMQGAAAFSVFARLAARHNAASNRRPEAEPARG